MSAEPEQISVRILDREYRVLCTPDEKKGLVEAALQLDQRMRDIRNAGKLSSVEKIAVMCALNLVDELNTASKQQRDRAEIDQRVLELADRMAGEHSA